MDADGPAGVSVGGMQQMQTQPPSQIALYPPSGAEASTSQHTVHPTLQNVADQGLHQLHDVISAVKRLFAASQQAPLQPAELDQLKQQYLQGTATLRETIKQCQ
jgi:hypothetical protein